MLARPDEQRRTDPPAEPRLVELDLHVDGVLDGVQSILMRDAILSALAAQPIATRVVYYKTFSVVQYRTAATHW